MEFLEDSAQELERESSKFKKSREQWVRGATIARTQPGHAWSSTLSSLTAAPSPAQYDEVYSSAPPRTGQEPPPPPRNQGGGSSAPRG